MADAGIRKGILHVRGNERVAQVIPPAECEMLGLRPLPVMDVGNPHKTIADFGKAISVERSIEAATAFSLF